MTAVEDARELLSHVELVGIELYELRARATTRENVAEFEEAYEIKAAVNNEPGTLRTRFTLTFNAKDAEYVVDLAPRYDLADGIEVPQTVAVEFVEKVGIMAAFPFLRENLFGLATRMGRPVPVLGIVRQGDFRLTPDDPEPEAVDPEGSSEGAAAETP